MLQKQFRSCAGISSAAKLCAVPEVEVGVAGSAIRHPVAIKPSGNRLSYLL